MPKDTLLWKQRFEELKDYRKKHGHCLVPQHYQQNKQLANWVNKQRQQYKKNQRGEKSSLTKERIAELKSIDFDFAPSRGRRRKRKNEGPSTTKNLSSAAKLQSENRVDEGNHENNKKKQRRLKKCDFVYPDVAPTTTTTSSLAPPTEGAIVDERRSTDISTETESSVQQQHFRDECLVIALIRADREVWGIIHT